MSMCLVVIKVFKHVFQFCPTIIYDSLPAEHKIQQGVPLTFFFLFFLGGWGGGAYNVLGHGVQKNVLKGRTPSHRKLAYNLGGETFFFLI